MSVKRFARQRFGENRARGDERIDVDAGVITHRFEQEREVFRDDVSRRARRVRTAAKARLARVDGGDARFECCDDVRQPLTARVMKVRATGLATEFTLQAAEQAPDLRRIRVAARIRQTDLAD